ncbi:site-specific DNA-methyltransferase [bacterium]|nr:site-specific DNA-methyltransferase [bacterium]
MSNLKNGKYINKIFHSDALEFLPKLKNNSIDLILTDPPYFLDKFDDKWSPGVVANKKNLYAVKSLPAGMKFDKKQGEKLYRWFLEISKEVFRILKPGGFFLSFSSPRLYHRMASAMDDTGFLIRDCFLWIYTQNQAKAMSLDHFIQKANTSQQEREEIKKKLKNWKTPQIKSCFEPIAVAQKPTEGTFLSNMIKYEVGLVNTNARVGNNMFPSNILTTGPIDAIMDQYFIVPKPTKKEKGFSNHHLTVKPLSLCEQLIRLITFSEDSVVLDPFLGSGTTAVAAKNLKRKFIGCDINQEYVKIARERLQKKEEGRLFE